MADKFASNTELSEEVVRSTQGMTVKVFKGSFWVLAGQVLPLMATFIATPFVIRYLGSEAYGVLILVGLISSYFSFADFGMGLASTKLGSEAYGEGMPDKEGLVVRTAALIALFSSLLIAIPMYLFSDWIVGDILKVEKNLQTTAAIALKITSAAFICNFIAGVFNTSFFSRMRIDIYVAITAGSKIVMILVTPVVLYYGGGIIQATFVALGAAVVIMGANIFFSGKLHPQLLKWTVSKTIAKALLRFGGNMVLYNIGLTLINNLEKFILTTLVSVKFLAYYSVATTFANMTTMVSMAMIPALIPAFSQMLAPNKKKELSILFSRTVKISILALIPSVMILLVIAKPFFTLWAGKEFGMESIYPFYILLVGIFFSIIVYVPNSILIASGRTNFFAKFYLLEIAPYIILAFLLIKQFGILGAALAFTIKEVVNSIVFINITKKYTGLYYDFKGQGKKLIIAFTTFLPAVILAFWGDSFSLWLIFLIPLCVVVYVWFVWKNLISTEERLWLIGRIRKLVGR